jgi:ABC-2 type transport system permease protein
MKVISHRRSFVIITRSVLSSQRYAPLVWGVSLGIACGLIVLIWPSISTSFGEIINNYPESIRKAFSIESLDSVEKYMDVEMLSIVVPLAIAFCAIRASIRPLVFAEEKGELDSLLALPVDRRVVVVSSFVGAMIMVFVILTVIFLMTWATGIISGVDIDVGLLAKGIYNVWPLALAFAGFAIFITGMVHSSSKVTAIASGTLIGMYIIDLLGKISPDAEPFRVISAYKYYGSAIQNGFSLSHAALLVAISIILMVIGAILFNRRDIV